MEKDYPKFLKKFLGFIAEEFGDELEKIAKENPEMFPYAPVNNKPDRSKPSFMTATIATEAIRCGERRIVEVDGDSQVTVRRIKQEDVG